MAEELSPQWDVRERVHIMPVGYELTRVVEPAENFRADRVILLMHEGNQKGTEGWKYRERVIEKLEQRDIPYDEIECNIFDLYSSLGTIAESISNHRDDDVYVNLSTGSKVTAIAGMIASTVLGASAYYVKAENYKGDFPDDISNVTKLPSYPIDAPDHEQVNIMKLIDTWVEDEGPPTKGEVIHFSEQENLPFIRQNIKGKGKYRLLDSQVVEPLKQRDWISESKQGRNKVLTLTDEGKAALEAFKWMIDKDINWEKYKEDLNGDNSKEDQSA